VAIPADAYLVAKKKIKEQYILNISASLLQIAIIYGFLIWKGLLGIVIAQIIIKLIWTSISIALYEKSSKEAIMV